MKPEEMTQTMQRKSITTTASPRVVVNDLPGDVRVKGWDRTEILVESDADVAIALEPTPDGARIHCIGDCRIHVPSGATLEAGAVRGDARIGSVSGSLTLGEVSGDLRLRRTGAATVGAVFGDLSARGIAGSLSVANVYGDASVDRIAGDLTFTRVGADVRIGDVQGDVTVAAGADVLVDLTGQAVRGGAVPPIPPVPPVPPAPPSTPGWATESGLEVHLDVDLDDLADAGDDGGDARDDGGDDAAESAAPAGTASDSPAADPGPARHFDIRAGADVSLRLPPAFGATLTVTSGAGDVGIRVAGAQVERDGQTSRIVLGDGHHQLNVQAGGRVTLAPAAAEPWVESRTWGEMGDEFRTMAEQFAHRMESQLGAMTGQLSERLAHLSHNLPDVLIAAGLPDEEAERISERIRQAGERAAERAQRHIEHATRTVQRRADETTRRKAVKVAFRTGPGGEGEPRPAAFRWTRGPEAAPPAQASTEERMLVLRMLEQGKITTDDAERLLAALEGRRP